MRAFTKAQRARILERLKHNHKYSIVVSCAKTCPQEDAQDFASVLQEAGWTVSGPFANEKIYVEGIQIGVPDLRSPCPSAHLLLDVLVSVGFNVKFVRAAETLPSAFFEGCSLLLGSSLGIALPGAHQRETFR